jgi:hypothetical protein
MSTRNTDEIFSPVEEAPIADGHTTRFIDVHIYDLAPEEDEPPTVESSCEAEPAAPTKSDSDQQEPAQPPRRHITGRLLLVAGLTLCLVLAGAVSFVSLVPILTPSASVTIVPDATLITSTDTIAVVTGTPTVQQLAGRRLSSVSMSQAQTTATTGTAHQDARAAHGYVTFYNGEPSIQVVTAGTLLTGTDGVQVMTDQDAIIPAVVYPTLGQVTVAAHATMSGPGGNIAAADIYGPCCRLNVSAVNGAFVGGQNARTYRTVTQQDINTVASHLTASLDQSVQAALQTQVQNGETLVTPLPCRQKVQPDHQPGEEATQVHILVSETCTGEVYTYLKYRDLIEKMGKYWNRYPFEDRQALIALLVRRVYLEPLSHHFMKITIDWKEFPNDVGIIWRRYADSLYWTPEEDQMLHEMYPTKPAQEILQALPRRTWSGIFSRAHDLHIRRLERTRGTTTVDKNTTFEDLQIIKEYNIPANNLGETLFTTWACPSRG